MVWVVPLKNNQLHSQSNKHHHLFSEQPDISFSPNCFCALNMYAAAECILIHNITFTFFLQQVLFFKKNLCWIKLGLCIPHTHTQRHRVRLCAAVDAVEPVCVSAIVSIVCVLLSEWISAQVAVEIWMCSVTALLSHLQCLTVLPQWAVTREFRGNEFASKAISTATNCLSSRADRQQDTDRLRWFLRHN